MKLVLDTNVLLSTLLWPKSELAGIVMKAKTERLFVFSEATRRELLEVVARDKFNRWKPYRPRMRACHNLFIDAHFVEPTEIITDCRDPKDNKFLEVAVAAKADALITGDSDLLTLHPFRGIPILTPRQFLALVGLP